MSASDQNSNKLFLRNAFSQIFEDLFTMTLFTKITHIYDQTKNYKLKLRSKFHVSDKIFEKMLVVKCLLENYSTESQI